MRRMRLAVAALVALGMASIASAESNLTIPESVFDFGFAPQKSKLTHVFWLKSTGTDSLIIDKVVPGCSCTQAPMDKDRIAVGDSAKLEIIFDTKTNRTSVTKRPKIFVAGSDLPRSVQIVAQVLPNPDSAAPVRLDPYILDISQFGEKVRKDAEFTIYNVSDKPLSLDVVSIQSDYFELTLPKSVAAGESAKAKVSIKDDKLPESFEKSITIDVKSENADAPQRYTLPIVRKVREFSSELKAAMSPPGGSGSK